MVAAMIQFTIEIQIANSALDVHLSNLEKHQEWQDCLAISKPRKAVPPPRHPAS
jgi:type II secretory pathway component PulL